MALLLLLLLFFLTSVFFSAANSQICRCLPSDACWPDAKAWDSFNSSIDGVLVQVKPVASVCHDPDYDEEACKLVTQMFTDPFWRADQPGALQGTNWEMDGEQGCLIGDERSATCSQGAIPVYAVSVSKPSHVQKAVVFAAEHNLRLVIKNTGHEFTGRNTAPGSLSIWMHHLKEITFSDSFLPSECASAAERPWPRLPRPFKNCASGAKGPWPFRNCTDEVKNTSSVKVGAGVQWEELYSAANQSGKIVVGAQCTSVGASGGYAQGAGHSQISPTFGLAADNILEFEVVTADGKLVVANACKNKDLFWALRGGGGGTFGVVISATHATHPALESLVFASYIVTAAAATNSSSSASFKGLVSHFVGLNPSLSDSGWGGFFILGPQTLTIQYLLPNKNIPFALQTFQPLLSYIEDQEQELKIVNGQMQPFSSYYEWHRTIQCSGNHCGYPSGIMLFEASRLIPRKVVETSPSQLGEALVTIQDLGYGGVSGYLVGGGKVSMSQDNAVNPAWREALFHVLFGKQFAANSTLEAKLSLAKEITDTNKILRDMTPGSGTYINEADSNEPEWKESFFGSNYMALKAIKEMVDPEGLFVCRHCVGSEDWSENLNCRVDYSG